MYETEFQTDVSTEIINQKAGSMTVGVTENENAVVVKVKGMDAAYTADEARELANAIQCTSDQRWDESADAAVEYLYDLADLVDGDGSAEEIEQRWERKELNP
jgi:hypothetical protein